MSGDAVRVPVNGTKGEAAMLLWEHLGAMARQKSEIKPTSASAARQTVRLPFDTRCAALTKSGKRCRGRVLPDKEHCVFHDPETAAKRESARLKKSSRRNKLARLPDGYLRKLTSRRTLGEAMDRLYREVRLGIITPDMGRVLFDVLTRLLDSGLVDGGVAPRAPQRSRAERLRPKMSELLTRAERRAWMKAVEAAPVSLKDGSAATTLKPNSDKALSKPSPRLVPGETGERALTIPLQAAS
jgi:hypothetical protein